MISLIGGAIGAVVLLLTPPSVFARLVPWLVLFATVLFAWGSFIRKPPKPGEAHHLPPWGEAITQFGIATYGGYFGGGIGLLMMASLTMAGLAVRNAGATKNVLAGAIERLGGGDLRFLPGRALAAGRDHRRRRLDRRLGRGDHAEDGEREAAQARRRRDRPRADGRAFRAGVTPALSIWG